MLWRDRVDVPFRHFEIQQKDARVALPPAAHILQITCHRGPSPYYWGGGFWRRLMYSAGAEIRAWQQGKKKVKWAYNHSPAYLRCSLAQALG